MRYAGGGGKAGSVGKNDRWAERRQLSCGKGFGRAQAENGSVKQLGKGAKRVSQSLPMSLRTVPIHPRAPAPLTCPLPPSIRRSALQDRWCLRTRAFGPINKHTPTPFPPLSIRATTHRSSFFPVLPLLALAHVLQHSRALRTLALGPSNTPPIRPPVILPFHASNTTAPSPFLSPTHVFYC
jgi:hypothetical protein